MGEFGINARPNGKEPADQLQRLPQRGGRRIRAEVERTIFLDPPYNT
jgi:hypothetical protein